MAPEKHLPTTRRRDRHYARVESYPPDGADVHVIELNSMCDCSWNAAKSLAESAAHEWGRGIATTWLRDEHMPKRFFEYVRLRSGEIITYELQESDLPF